MTDNTQVGIGPAMPPEQEAAYRAQTAAAHADQLEAEAAAMADKVEGWKQALKDKKAEAKAARADADRLEKGGD